MTIQMTIKYDNFNYLVEKRGTSAMIYTEIIDTVSQNSLLIACGQQFS